ncbi:hypothetical protein D3C79_610830 [compost metagenome]
MAVHAAAIGSKQVHAPERLVAQRLRIPLDEALQRARAADDGALEGSDGLGDPIQGDVIIPEGRGEGSRVVRAGSQPHQQLVVIQRHLHRVVDGVQGLLLQRADPAIPELGAAVGGIEDGRGIAGPLLAEVADRDAQAIAPAFLGIVTAGTADVAGLGKLLVEEQLLAQHHLGPTVRVVGREGHRRHSSQLLPLHPFIHIGGGPLGHIAGVLCPQRRQIRHGAVPLHRGAHGVEGDRIPEQAALPFVEPAASQRLVESLLSAILQPDLLGQGEGEGMGITPALLVGVEQALELRQGRQAPGLLTTAGRALRQLLASGRHRVDKALPRQPVLAALDPGDGAHVVQTVPGALSQQLALFIQSQQVGGLGLPRDHGLGRIERKLGGLDRGLVGAAIPTAGGTVPPQRQQHLPAVGVVELGPQSLGPQQGGVVLDDGLLLQADLAALTPFAGIEGTVTIAIAEQEEGRLLLIQSQCRHCRAASPIVAGSQISHQGAARPQDVAILLTAEFERRTQQQAGGQSQGRIALAGQRHGGAYPSGALAQTQGRTRCQSLTQIDAKDQIGPGMGLQRRLDGRGDDRRIDDRRDDDGRLDNRRHWIGAVAAVVVASGQGQQAGQQ